jgi:UDP-N-acetylmuramate: L-alanyl-gamma-D-glutamyl-meso-diaminopimelate ligase
MDKNCIPDNVETIHLIAVCGTGMGALACMLQELGFTVTGSDQNVYPPMSRFLAQKGITVAKGFDGANLGHRPDLVVVGNAVTRDNPESVRMFEMGLHHCSMPQALNHFIAADKKAVMVTGTRAYFVVEGDEYDTAFFDKGPKFLHFQPHLAVVTSIEFDHADIFRDLDHVKDVFQQLLERTSAKSTLIAYDADENVQSMIGRAGGKVENYGRRSDSHWRLDNIGIDPPDSVFEVYNQGQRVGKFRIPMMGMHNLSNALAAVAIAGHLNIAAEVLAEALAGFKGIKRRQEIRGVKNGITVMDDFAHHPTAVRETIRAVRPFYPAGRIVAVFEPRTNSSMRRIFQDVYPDSFDAADLVCIPKPPMLHKIPADQRFSSEKLVQDLIDRGKAAYFFPDTDGIIDFLAHEARAGDLILIMSNGGFDNIHERLLQQL